MNLIKRQTVFYSLYTAPKSVKIHSSAGARAGDGGRGPCAYEGGETLKELRKMTFGLIAAGSKIFGGSTTIR